MDLTNTYYAIEIWEDYGVWRYPACWGPFRKKRVPDRVRQLKKEGFKVRVKEVKEYREERVVTLKELR